MWVLCKFIIITYLILHPVSSFTQCRNFVVGKTP
jgi:hypothetical protein